MKEYGPPKRGWLSTPLERFREKSVKKEDGSWDYIPYPFGDGKAHRLVVNILYEIEDAYEALLPDEETEEGDRFEQGEAAVIRDGHRSYEELGVLTLSDLPAVLDTLVVLEEEKNQRDREEAERKAAARKERARIRAKERRKLKKLGEW